MRNVIIFLLSILFLSSCATEDDFVPLSIEPVYSESLDVELEIDIIYVKDPNFNEVLSKFNEQHFVEDLNGKYFHRNGIGFKLGKIDVVENEELFDLKDNRGEEQEVFLNETERYTALDRITVFVIKRSNIYGIGGMGYGQRVLLTDEHIFKSTSPHEIGHALGLGHTVEEGNIMCTVKPHLRKEFTSQQINAMKQKIKLINRSNNNVTDL